MTWQNPGRFGAEDLGSNRTFPIDVEINEVVCDYPVIQLIFRINAPSRRTPQNVADSEVGAERPKL
jgi:hypothetical protein